MLSKIRIVLSIIVIILALFGLLTKNYDYQAYMTLALGLFMLIAGIDEFKKERKIYGYMFFAVSLFAVYVAIQGFFL